MSEVKKCPKCGRQLTIAHLNNAPYWNQRVRAVTGFGWNEKVFTYKCRNCGYVEFGYQK
jgi:ribosomal protein S27AE